MPKTHHYKNCKGEEIDLQVLVYTRPNLRGSLDEMLMYQGKTCLDNIFDKLKIDEETTKVHLEYPERWTNILEQRTLFYKISFFYPNIQKLTIKTHSVYIIQCIQNDYIGICDDHSKFPQENYTDPQSRYCPFPNEMNGLMVFHG